jgi:putative ABC transport system permease protein
MLDLLRQDVRYAIRALGRSPLFALVSVLSIAIGVGATTGIVTLANTLLLRPPPGVALGAQRSHVLGLVLRQGVVLAAGGVVVGSLAAAGATRLIANLLYGVPPTDVIAFGGAALALALAALAASWIPARRATRVDPIIALRSE